MKKRLLRNLEVSSLGLGCWGMSHSYGRADEKESIETIHKAFDLGINFFDTADIYGLGENEKIVGKALKDKRQNVIIASKFGFYEKNNSTLGVNGEPEYVRKACEASLKRLSVDFIDLYYLHRVDKEVAIEDTLGAMSELVTEGKVRFLGISEASSKTIRKANSVHPITALQSEYSLWTRDVEKEILTTCKDLNIGFVAFSPLGRGFLTGQMKHLDKLDDDDFRKNLPRFQKENLEKNLVLLRELEKIAKENNIKLSQLALNWLFKRGDNIVPIPGTKRINYLQENIDSVGINLNKESIERISNIIKDFTGSRYSETGMTFLDL